MKDSGRVAVMRQSSWRRDPAAALRGFANGSLPLAQEELVHGREVLLLEQHLAAHLEARPGRARQPVGTPRFAWRRPTVRRLAVTSSPLTPSPRVDPWTKRPSA